MDFEWDDAKAQSNLHKHGVSFEEAATAFADPLAALFPTPITRTSKSAKSWSGSRSGTDS